MARSFLPETLEPNMRDMPSGEWSYDEAFSRNLGLISRQEQQRLKGCRVALPGMGGVGGLHLITLARLGIGAFRIADPDTFEIANFNRQLGCELQTLGHPKAAVMRDKALQVNPELTIDVLQEPVTRENVDEFLRDVDVMVDSIDFFSFDTRRLLFRKCQELGIWAVTAGPIGFSTVWLLFDPAGMSFDRYFDMHDGMDELDQFSAFHMGLTPRATHLKYFDLSQVSSTEKRGPSLSLACALCSGVAGAEVVKILLRRGPLRPVPCYAQFDAYWCLLRRGRLRGGNRHPLQRLKRNIFRRRMRKLGYGGRVE